MNKFGFEIKELLSRKIEIKANSIDEAYEKVKEMYEKEEIVLDDSDYINTRIVHEYDVKNKEELMK